MTKQVEGQEPEVKKEGVIQSGSLAGKSLWFAIWFLAIPILVQQILYACVGLVDKMLAGALPESIVLPAMDAIGIGSYIGWFISIAVSGVGIGAQALIARSMGSGDVKQGEKVLGQSLTFAFVWGIFVAIGLWFLAAPLGDLCNLSADAKEYLVSYIRVLAIGMPACSVMTAGSMSLHGSGDTIRPTIVTAIINIVNIVVSWVLSGANLRFQDRFMENPFDWDMHVVGIAIGTTVAHFVGAVLIVYVLIRGAKDIKLHISTLIPHRETFFRIAKIGVPNFFEGLSMWVANLFVLQFIGQIAVNMAKTNNSETVTQGLQGAHVIAIQWESFSFLPGFAIGIAAGTLAGQYLGANNPRLARKAVYVCTGLAMLLMGTLGVVMMLAGDTLTAIVSIEPLHTSIVPKLLFIGGATQIIFAVMMVIRQSLKGLGDTTWTFAITSFSSWCIRLPAAWYLGVHLNLGLEGIWYALCGEMFIRAALFYARFLNGSWCKEI